MKKYVSFFRLRFSMGLQYRAAALAGISTQAFWGGMEILMFRAFYRADPSAFPMSLESTSVYVWLQQAFLALFMGWVMENEIFESIQNGNIAYELCRPIGLYRMLFVRSLAYRLSRAVLRCFPILLIAAFLPPPYGISFPPTPVAGMLFLLGMVLGLFVAVAFTMLIYALSFFTISPAGIRMVALSALEILSGSILPIPFFPKGMQRVLEILPFAAMQNVPLRIYSGDISGYEAIRALSLQAFWLVVLVGTGVILMNRASKKITLQGG